MNDLSIAAVFTITIVASLVSVAQDSWPTYQGNPKHDGYVPVTVNPTSFSLLWETQLNVAGYPLNPIAVADGIVFVSLDATWEDTTQFFALDSMTGGVLWDEVFGSIYSVGPPAYADNKAYIQVGQDGSSYCFLYEYNAMTGVRLNDSTHICGWEYFYAPTIFNGAVFTAGGGSMFMYNFDAVPFEQWVVPQNQYDKWTPAVDGQYAYAYTGLNDPKVSIVEIDTGFETGTIPDSNFNWHTWSMELAPVLGGSNDLLAAQQGRLLSFDISNQTIRYEITDAFDHQVSVAQGVIYVINNGNLEARDQMTGAYIWDSPAPTGTGFAGTMIVTDSHVFVNARDPYYPYHESLYAIDLVTHSTVWSYPEGGHLAWSEGVLYVARKDGYLTAFAEFEIFADDFEMGNLSAWSGSTP